MEGKKLHYTVFIVYWILLSLGRCLEGHTGVYFFSSPHATVSPEAARCEDKCSNGHLHKRFNIVKKRMEVSSTFVAPTCVAN
uniref:Putative secreted protein n=1 Tax=Amblyomma cajennense TaxID=34607 RepID=A0A023FBC6_AMBCJ